MTDAKENSRDSGILIESQALRRNLEETAVREVIIDPRYQVLQEVVEDYRGLRKTVDGLLFELNHPYRNWQVILPELRSFALKNLEFYGRHVRGHQAVDLIINIFLDAVRASKRTDLQEMAIEYMLAYLEKVVQTPLDGMEAHLPSVVEGCFSGLLSLSDEQLSLLSRAQHALKRIGRGLLTLPLDGFHLANFNRLLAHSLQVTYEYWLQEEDPLVWFTREFGEQPSEGEAAEALNAISHARVRQWLKKLDVPEEVLTSRSYSDQLLALPSHRDIARLYREVPDRLIPFHAIGRPEEEGLDPPSAGGKILFLFRMMEISGLGEVHEETLRSIQRSLTTMIRSESPEHLESFLLRTFELLKENVVQYPRTALQCIQAIGHEVFEKRRSRLVEIFLEQVVQFGFQPPEVMGVDNEWQWLYNEAHLLNMRVWLDLICLNPKWCTTLLSALIINLKLGGACIRDTDLFQKDISKLLKSDIEPVFNLIKQLTKLIPSFFNEIGAEGLVRDVSTDVDEIHLRKDPLIHFLRKQSHVQSSNLIVEFIEEILRFWLTRDKTGLRRFLPEEVYQQVSASGGYVEEANRILRSVSRHYPLDRIRALLNVSEEQMEEWVSRVRKVSERDKTRVLLLFRMYRLVYQKYYLGFQEIQYHLSQAQAHGFPGLDRLKAVLAQGQTEPCLGAILDYLELLKKIILSPDAYEVIEDIYHKRHIAADIPSMYGRYYERKFDALGLSLRLENLANVYFERLIDSVNLSFITRATFFRIIRCIRLFIRAMQVDGVSSQRLDTHLKLLEKSLEVRRFTYTQYLDIIRGLSEGVKDILNVYYTDVHKDNLTLTIHQLGHRNILPTYVGHGEREDDADFVHQVSERFLRDVIASTFGLQYLDNFLTKIHQTLALQEEILSEEDLDLLMTYDPDKVICPIHDPARLTNDLIHLGAKGYNLVTLASYGIPVPPGFIVTTEIFRCYGILQDIVHAHEDFLTQLREHMGGLEKECGRQFGDPDNPLLISVRSGAAISMPGMMDTILNLGINEEIADGLSRSSGNPWFAWDNYRRFLQSWGMSFGIEREVFNEIMRTWKARYGVDQKREFTGEQMREMTLAYRQTLINRRIRLSDEPLEQLEIAIRQVINSWYAPKARDYREIMGISDDWGTAVIIQAMVFGNRGEDTGSGVLFTANPMKRMRRVVLWGDFTSMNQGEDIVGGLVSTYPISKEQQELTARHGEMSLEDRFADVYGFLGEISRGLVYDKRWNPQEIEFTFEGPDAAELYLLQTRDMVTLRSMEAFPVFIPSTNLHESYLGKGTGVSGSALSGRAVFTIEEIHAWREKDPDVPLILVRSDTVPDDVKAISLSNGLLTAKGGQTSHAAIVALRLGKTCVVGCSGLILLSDGGPCRIHQTEIKSGDHISIDGREGSIYMGRHAIQQKALH